MKTLVLLLSMLLFTACGSKKFYTLGENINVVAQTTSLESIDVVKVLVPKYLKEHKVVRQITPYQIELVDKAHWLIPMEKKLTDILIEYLQQSMNNPNVHLYPWDSDNETKRRVAVDIKRFIASNTEVVLKANYKIMDLENRSTQIKHFETSVATTPDIQNMMKAMEEAYMKLLEEITITLINNKSV
ncbi:MAG: Unknown protein [uncultured Sulfurovum sp.]|uniref:ABC-type transport auxiliary lipoprotein component domain-containing protein n=1 Tax=uncultured Sulfurovum sp. TaxID=269237 RepID=A0A6S6TWT4_9BACT|nr:MAG: Unknown protein [uncultured Sulfurovum sp.]